LVLQGPSYSNKFSSELCLQRRIDFSRRYDHPTERCIFSLFAKSSSLQSFILAVVMLALAG
jgi:hypothetical protein